MIFPTKVTVLAGTNNSGKSNVLRYLQTVIPEIRKGTQGGNRAPSLPAFDFLDRPTGYIEHALGAIGVPHSLIGVDPPTQRAFESGLPKSQSLIDWQLFVMHLLRDGDYYWATYEKSGTSSELPPGQIEQAIQLWPGQGFHAALVRRMPSEIASGTSSDEARMSRLLASIGGFNDLPPVVTIEASRRAVVSEPATTGEEAGSVAWLSGFGVINALARLQNPSHGSWGDSKVRWDAINRFVQYVLDDDSARINIPYDAQTIQVETPQRVLPLANLGSGIEQVIILASAATVISKHLVCIEEPETNLHPLLQKKLVKYLTDETDNQYVIATHSSHLLDDARATAYHLRMTPEGTVVRAARRSHELVNICHDLGYRPSDLMQANCVIWVEGPSDRIYLRKWLELVDPNLAEGIDYSVMFYGGSLLSHLTVDEEAVDDFINLRRLNRHSAILIDSDRSSSRQRINRTKKRVRDEFNEDGPGFAWITKCYTIENYVPHEVLADAVAEAHPGRRPADENQWSNPFAGPQRFDKIAVAREVEKRLTVDALSVYDLKQQIGKLVEFIELANG